MTFTEKDQSGDPPSPPPPLLRKKEQHQLFKNNGLCKHVTNLMTFPHHRHLHMVPYKYEDADICKGLLQPICLVIKNIWLDFLLEINPYFRHNLGQTVPLRTCADFREFPDTNIITDFNLSHYIELNNTRAKAKVFFGR